MRRVRRFQKKEAVEKKRRKNKQIHQRVKRACELRVRYLKKIRMQFGHFLMEFLFVHTKKSCDMDDSIRISIGQTHKNRAKTKDRQHEHKHENPNYEFDYDSIAESV